LFCQLQLAKDKLFSAQAVLSSLPTLHSGCAPTSQPANRPNQRLNYDRSLSYATVSWERPGSRLCTEFSHSPLLLLLLPKGPCSNINPLSNACAVPEDTSQVGKLKLAGGNSSMKSPPRRRGTKLFSLGRTHDPGNVEGVSLGPNLVQIHVSSM
jgi:hypothetical protein